MQELPAARLLSIWKSNGITLQNSLDSFIHAAKESVFLFFKIFEWHISEHLTTLLYFQFKFTSKLTRSDFFF